MEILRTTLDKMGLSSKRFITFFVVFFVALPVVLMVTSLHRNSSFALFEGFTKGKVEVETAENVTNELLSTVSNVTTNGLPLGERVQHITDDNSGRVSEALQGGIQNGSAIEGSVKAKNIPVSEVGSKNVSLTSSTNESSSSTDDKDKLLDGLLASGFDEESCISRFQSHSYRKASPHKPSPYLISKLRNYEEIHRRCGPNSRAYFRTMKKIVHYKSHGAAAMCKYVVWTPANGLGNQIMSMAATFLYAILTDRVLLVRFGKDKHGLFCEPFLNSTWILRKNSPFWDQNHVETYQPMLEKDIGNNSTGDLPSALFLKLAFAGLNGPEKFFHCDHTQNLLQKVPMLIFQSDQYFVPSMFMIPSFNQEATKMFPDKVVFHHLGRYLFHPANEAWGQISRYYQVYLANADERIGLQIRVFNPASTPHQAVMNLLLSCTTMNKLLPEVEMQNSVSSSQKNLTQKAVLVASLYPEYGDNLRTMYLKNPTVNGELVGVYQPSHEGYQKHGDNVQSMKAWMEMYLLSLSDVLVTTSLSTFGYVAQGLGGLKPWLLFRLTNNGTHFPPCVRDFSVEPCYHDCPRHSCNGKPLNDFLSSFLYMRECKDFKHGVKLFNNGSTS